MKRSVLEIMLSIAICAFVQMPGWKTASGQEEASYRLRLNYHNYVVPNLFTVSPPSRKKIAEVYENNLYAHEYHRPMQTGLSIKAPNPFSRKINLSNLHWVKLPSGGKAAAFSVTSPGAKELRLEVACSRIEKGVEIRFFKPDDPVGSHTPYTSEDLYPLPTGVMGFDSMIISGQSIGVEIYMPDDYPLTRLNIAIPIVFYLLY